MADNSAMNGDYYGLGYGPNDPLYDQMYRMRSSSVPFDPSQGPGSLPSPQAVHGQGWNPQVGTDFSLPNVPMPQTDEYNRMLEERKQHPPSLTRRILGGMVGMYAPSAGAAIAEPGRRALAIQKLKSDIEEQKVLPNLERAARIQYSLEAARERAGATRALDDARLAGVQSKMYEGSVDLPSTQTVEQPPGPVNPIDEGSAYQDALNAPPGSPRVGQPVLAQYPRQIPAQYPGMSQLPPRPALLGGQQPGTNPYKPIPLTPQQKAEQDRQTKAAEDQAKIDAQRANWKPLPPNMAAALGVDPKELFDPNHLPALAQAVTAMQTQKQKSPEEIRKERLEDLDFIKKHGYSIDPKDASSYLAQGKFTEYPPQGPQAQITLVPTPGGGFIPTPIKPGIPLPSNIISPSQAGSANAADIKGTDQVNSDLGYAQDYLASGTYTGPGDEALMEKFFDMAKPSTGFRMSQPQIDMLMKARSWMESAQGIKQHATTGVWFPPDQRKQIVDTMAALGRAKTGGRGGAPATPQGQTQGVLRTDVPPTIASGIPEGQSREVNTPAGKVTLRKVGGKIYQQ